MHAYGNVYVSRCLIYVQMSLCKHFGIFGSFWASLIANWPLIFSSILSEKNMLEKSRICLSFVILYTYVDILFKAFSFEKYTSGPCTSIEKRKR